MVRNELIEEILKLDPADRQYIRDVLVASLSDDLPPQLSPEDQKELLRRFEDALAHPEKLLTWEQVKEQLAAQRAARPQ